MDKPLLLHHTRVSRQRVPNYGPKDLIVVRGTVVETAWYVSSSSLALTI